MPLNVCVVGSGISGLTTIKELKELGHKVQCFDKHDQIGGLFYGWTVPKDGFTPRFSDTLLTVSNSFIAYSCFPPEKNDPRRFWTFKEYTDYLQRYCEHFNVLEHIQFNTTVTSVKKDEEKFMVEIEHHGKKETVNFDAVAICIGSHQVPVRPKLPGEETFKGTIEHSEDVKETSAYNNKKVVSIALGESAAEILAQIAKVTSSLVISMRHYPTILTRYRHDGHVADAISSRAILGMRSTLEELYLRKIGTRHVMYGNSDEEVTVGHWLLRSVGPRRQFFTKSDDFFPAIAAGQIQVNAAGIREVKAHSVVFNDGFEAPADCIIMNTGFRQEWGMVKDLVTITNVRKDLWKNMIHPDMGEKLAFIGFVRPETGGSPQMAELQARYFAQLLHGSRQLPKKAQMQLEMTADQSYAEHRFALTPSIPTLVDYHKYGDEIAEKVGCKPSIFSLITKPILLYKFYFATQLCAHYRLSGPGADKQAAEEAIGKLEVAFTHKDAARLFLMRLYERVFEYLSLDPTHELSYQFTMAFGIFSLIFLYYLGPYMPAYLALLLFFGSLYIGRFGEKIKNHEAVQARRVACFKDKLDKMRSTTCEKESCCQI